MIINNNNLMQNKRKAVFLDRDGTINYDSGYTYKFSEFRFRPYVIKGLKYLCKNKYFIFIVTNQAGIAKGKFKIKELPLQKADIIKTHGSIKKLKDYINFIPKTNLNKGVKEFINWFDNTYKLYISKGTSKLSKSTTVDYLDSKKNRLYVAYMYSL